VEATRAGIISRYGFRRSTVYEKVSYGANKFAAIVFYEAIKPNSRIHGDYRVHVRVDELRD